jgi:hypothetical protein
MDKNKNQSAETAQHFSCEILNNKDFANLRALASIDVAPRVMVDRLDLIELLAEVDALRGGASRPASKYSAEFEEAWTLYPSRPGASKAATYKAWTARLKAGATALEMIEGTAKYAAYCKAERTEAAYIKQPATFYGPGEHYAADWSSRRPPGNVGQAGPGRGPRPPLSDINAANNVEALRLLGQPTFYPDDGMTIEAAP